MLRKICIKGRVIEQSTTQITYLKLQANIQLMLLIIIKPTVQIIKKTSCNFIGGVVTNKHNTYTPMIIQM